MIYYYQEYIPQIIVGKHLNVLKSLDIKFCKIYSVYPWYFYPR